VVDAHSSRLRFRREARVLSQLKHPTSARSSTTSRGTSATSSSSSMVEGKSLKEVIAGQPEGLDSMLCLARGWD
jgi:hypothetical protein